MAKSTAAEGALVTGLKQLIGHTYVMYFRAHSAHWNVTGDSFITLPGFFGGIYEDLFGSIDPLAESVRQHGEMMPSNLPTLLNYGANQADASKNGVGSGLLKELQLLNTKMMSHLAYVRGLAESAEDYGLANFIQDREAVHLKLDWQIRALLT